MYDQRVAYAIDNFIEESFFSANQGFYLLTEEEESGKTELKVDIDEANLCIADFDHKPKCSFLRNDKKSGMQKSSDHVIFYRKDDKWKLCIIEMKTTIGVETWKEVKRKTRATYINCIALAAVLGILIDIENVDVYTTYANEKFYSMEDTTNPMTYKPLLGQKKYDLKKEEWDKNQIRVNLGEYVFLHHCPIRTCKNAESGILEGFLKL